MLLARADEGRALRGDVAGECVRRGVGYPSQPLYERLYVKAIAPGTAILHTPLASQTLILNVHVVP